MRGKHLFNKPPIPEEKEVLLDDISLTVNLTAKILMAIIFIASFMVWTPLLQLHFVQDDFWIITGSRVFTVDKAIQGTNIGFMRPISTFWYPYILKIIFNEDPFFYHAVNNFINGITAIIVFFIAHLLTKNTKIAVIAGLIYGTHFIHLFEQSWFAGAQDILASFFFSTSFLLFLFATEKSSKKYHIFSIIAFIFAIFSKEASIILPAILLIYLVHKKIYGIKKIITFLIPYIVIVFIFIYGWLYFRTFPQSGPYQWYFDISIAKNLLIYLYWISYIGLLMVKIYFGNASDYYFFKNLPNEVSIVVITILVGILFIFIKANIFNKNSKQNITFFLLLAGLISILPVLFISQHLYSYYLDYALVFLSIVAGIYTVRLLQIFRFSLFIQILLFFILFFSIQYSIYQSYDTPFPLMSTEAKSYIETFKASLGPLLSSSNTIYLRGYSDYDFHGIMGSGSIFHFTFPEATFQVIRLNNTSIEVPKKCNNRCILIVKGNELNPIVI